MTSKELIETSKVYSEWQAGMCIDLFDQILKSPEMISKSARLSRTELGDIKKDQTKILESAILKEANEIIRKNKVKTEKDFYEAIEKIPDYQLRNLRRKMILEVISERFKDD